MSRRGSVAGVGGEAENSVARRASRIFGIGEWGGEGGGGVISHREHNAPTEAQPR